VFDQKGYSSFALGIKKKKEAASVEAVSFLKNQNNILQKLNQNLAMALNAEDSKKLRMAFLKIEEELQDENKTLFHEKFGTILIQAIKEAQKDKEDEGLLLDKCMRILVEEIFFNISEENNIS